MKDGKRFWDWKNSVEANGDELVIDGIISDMTWWGDEATPEDLRNEIAAHTGDLTVSLNSPGGDVFAGIAMMNALSGYKGGKVTVRVDGLAASIASVIAMAGDEIIMNAGSMMMIHKPWAGAVGNADDLAQVQQVLLQIEQSIIPLYAARTGMTNDQIQEMLNAETWLTASEAVEQGFADSLIEPKQALSAGDSIKQLLNTGRLALVNSVQTKSMKNLLEKIKNEEVEPEKEETKVEEPAEVVTPPENTEEEAPVPPVVPEAPEKPIEPPVVEEPTDKPAEETAEEEKEVKDEKKPVETAENLVEKPVAPKQDAPKVAKDYLESKQALTDFAQVLQDNAGKETVDVKQAWAEHLATKMGITNPDVMLPGGVINSIQDTLDGSVGIWGAVRKSGLTVFRTALNTVTGENSRAKGHTPGNTKVEQLITVADRTIRAQFIYKYITLDKATLKDNQDTNAVINYVLTELPKRILAELEQAIVIGDGREDEDENKISSFLSIKDDAATADGYAVEFNQSDEDESIAETFIKADAEVLANGDRYLVVSRATLVAIKLSKAGNGAYNFPFGSNVGSALGYAGVFTPQFMAADDALGYEFVADAYTTVGDTSIDAYTNFLLAQNKQEYLQEVYAGGALAQPKSAVAIVAGS